MNLLPAFVGAPELNKVYHCDAFELMRHIPDGSIDAVITDPPYGLFGDVIQWDVQLDLDALWKAFNRILKPDGVVIMTATQPFASRIVLSNVKNFREELVWDKVMVSNVANAKIMHLRSHENVYVFGKNIYYEPQLTGKATLCFGKRSATNSDIVGSLGTDYQEGVGYPKSILTFPRPNNLTGGGLHPTQKPLDLMKYLVRTYSKPNDTILDPFAGSGTTAIAAYKTGRNFICGDITEDYVKSARERLDRTRLDKPIPVTSGVFQRTIFEIAGD